MTRGILYLVWGDAPRGVLQRSIDSADRWHPELPVEVMELPAGSTLLDKSRMGRLTPFDTTLFLDADTVVLDRLDYAFDSADRHGLACCICECPWARRYPSLSGDEIEYNTGALWWTKEAATVFDVWEYLSHTIDSSITFQGEGGAVLRMPLNDQGAFAAAVRDTGYNPWVLPMNWNLRPQWQRDWFGPVKIWHDYRDPPPGLLAFNEAQSQPGAMISHARL